MPLTCESCKSVISASKGYISKHKTNVKVLFWCNQTCLNSESVESVTEPLIPEFVAYSTLICSFSEPQYKLEVALSSYDDFIHEVSTITGLNYEQMDVYWTNPSDDTKYEVRAAKFTIEPSYVIVTYNIYEFTLMFTNEDTEVNKTISVNWQDINTATFKELLHFITSNLSLYIGEVIPL